MRFSDLDTSSFKVLHSSILSYPWSTVKCKLKEDFSKPRKVCSKISFLIDNQLAINTANFSIVGRDKAIKEVFTSFSDRFTNRLCNEQDTKSNIITAIHGPTGGGKSFLLDEIARLDPNDLKLCPNNDLRVALKSSVSITTSFNGWSPIIPAQEQSIEIAMALRILFG